MHKIGNDFKFDPTFFFLVNLTLLACVLTF